MASQGRARPLATTGAIMSTRKQDTDAGCDRWPRGPRSTRLAADTDHGKAERCRCTIATLHIRRLSPSASAGRAACKGCHHSDGGSGAGTIRAMSTAEMPAGEVVSPSARCARLRQQVPLRASSPRVAASRCAPLPRVHASAHCAHLRPLITAVPASRLPPALRSPRAADAAGQASCARVTDDDPMSGRRLAPLCTSHADDAAERRRRHERTRFCIAAAMCARARSSPPMIQARSGARRLRDTGRGLRAAAPWSGRASLRWSIPAVEEIIARPLNTVSPCVLPRHLYWPRSPPVH